MALSKEMQQFHALDSLLAQDDEDRAPKLEKRKNKNKLDGPPSGHFKDLDSYLTQHATVTEIKAKSGLTENGLPADETLLSRFAPDVALILGSLLVVAVLSLLMLQGDVPISGSRVTLGERGYYSTTIAAPAVSGFTLGTVSKFLSSSRMGPWIRRSLLNGNQLEGLRELSAQVALPPTDYPLYRADDNTWQQAASDAGWFGSSPDMALLNGFNMELMHAKELQYSTIMDYHFAFKANHTTPIVVMTLTIAKMREWEREGYPIFSSFDEEDVLRQAQGSSARYARGQPISVLDGVPVAFKDLMDIEGHITYNGKNSQSDWGNSQVSDDNIVSRFRRLGAIVFGATIMTEGGMSPLGYSAHHRGPFNAYSAEHFSGGSSSGSAVAVSSGLVPLAIGFDSGGSVRLPAAWSGLHGLAPTFGRVPLQKEIYMSMIKAGPIANCALDAALGYAAMAATPADKNGFYGQLYDGGVRGPPPAHVRGLGDVADLSDIRIGVYPDWLGDSTPAIKALTEKAIDFFVQRGATVVKIDIPHMNWLALAHGVKISTEYASEWDLLHHTRQSDLDANTRLMLSTASSLSALEVLSADRLRAWAFNYTTHLFRHERLSVIITPTTGFTAPVLRNSYKSHGLSDTALVMRTMKHVFFANLIGLPAHSVPIGFSKCPETGKELPVGMQLIGKHWGEHVLLRLANAVDLGDVVRTRVPKEHFFNPLVKARAYAKMQDSMSSQH